MRTKRAFLSLFKQAAVVILVAVILVAEIVAVGVHRI